MRYLTFSLFFAVAIQAQVLDVNGDKTVGAEEAIAVAEQWKGPASGANAHNHLGQTWTGSGNPLTIRGNYPGRLNIKPLKSERKGAAFIPSAPLILDNTAPIPMDGPIPADLLVAGIAGTVSTRDNRDSTLYLSANSSVIIRFDENQSDFGALSIRNGQNDSVPTFERDGDLQLTGIVVKSGSLLRIDHPLDPANKYLVHSSVECPDMKNVYDGMVTLNENGAADVQLPDYFEAFNNDYRYQLTCIGGFAPVYVSEEIHDNEFKIASGHPEMEVSWIVTGVRNDVYAKANPIEVEQEKSEEEKGKYLHPELFGEPVAKSVGLVQGLGDE